MPIDDSGPGGQNEVEDELILSNGIDFETGELLLPPLPLETASRVAQGEKLDEEHLKELLRRHERTTREVLGVAEVDDPSDLSESGWGVIFARDLGDELPAIRQALGPLLELREKQAADLFQEYSGHRAYEAGETGREFADRHGQGPGPVDPEVMPFFLLLVGSPRQIPFMFQYKLGSQFAVGRIFFDTVDEYRRYAQSVAAAEGGEISRPRRLTCFGVRHDRATDLSADELVTPLAERIRTKMTDWEVRTLLAEEATKANLIKTLQGEKAPALLLTASHGVGFKNHHPLQRDTQGALLCQEFPTGGLRKAPKPEHYFAAADVKEDLDVAGLVAFFFACYGAGTPEADDFAHRAASPQKASTEEAFIARLPQRLLAKAGPDGKTGAGALAVIGQVERAWASSFHWSRVGSSITHFRDSFRRLLKGERVGWAMDAFSARYSQLASDMNDVRDPAFGEDLDEKALGRLWTTVNDARSYAILGDPAVRLVAAEPTA